MLTAKLASASCALATVNQGPANFHPLNAIVASTNGAFAPESRLVLGADGSLYGTTFYGGSSNLGAVFRVTTNGVLTTLVSFAGTNGANPVPPGNRRRGDFAAADLSPASTDDIGSYRPRAGNGCARLKPG